MRRGSADVAYIVGEIPFFDCLVRSEYTRDLKPRAPGDLGPDYYEAIAFGVRCERGKSLYFQTWLQKPAKVAGAMFLLPIEALVWKPCDLQPTATVQPWDVFSSDFGVHTFSLIKESRAYILPARKPARYKFTLDFTGSDLADFPAQHKHAHIVAADEGWFGAFPNNRVLLEDEAFCKATCDRPGFQALSPAFRAE